MSERRAFDYPIVRVVPRVDRDERLNVGVILFCPTAGYLGCRIALDERAAARAGAGRRRRGAARASSRPCARSPPAT